ncbi:hypothetical protein [Phenylobacterium sp.]|uniref:hypothetical protein n=1 Tax=Phenylobacterium sp. TaxID=1871053 RepID=UPI002F42673B
MAVKFDFKSLEQPFEVDWPVTVSEPQDGGTVKESVFTARIRLLTPEETESLNRKVVGEDGPADINAWLNGMWIGLGAEEGELTSELRGLLLSRQYVRSALQKAYYEAAAGAPSKNAVAPPAS